MDQLEAHRAANTALVAISRAAYVDLPTQLDDLLTQVIQGIRKPLSTPAKVSMLGLMRLKQEANATRMLLGLGYPVQGMALAANMVEIAYDLLYIRDDQTRAQLWEQHSDFDKNVWQGKNIKQRMRDGASSLQLTLAQVESMVEDDYKMYGILCGAKHGNPILNKQIGGVIQDGILLLGPQDYSTESDKLSAAFAIHAVFKTTVIAARAIVEYHIDETLRSKLEAQIAKFNDDRKIAIDPLLPPLSA